MLVAATLHSLPVELLVSNELEKHVNGSSFELIRHYFGIYIDEYEIVKETQTD